MKKISIALMILLSFGVAAGKFDLKEHHKQLDMQCEDCHGEVKGKKTLPAEETCMGCHGSYEELRAATAQPESPYYQDTNPHYSFHYNNGVNCIACHSEHGESRIYCNNCHQFEFKNFPE